MDLKSLDAGLTGASRIIDALDTDGNGFLEEDEFCDAIVRSFGWTVEQRMKNISKLAKKDPKVITVFEMFFDGVRFCVGHIIQRTSAAIVDRCLNPPETLDKSEAALLAADEDGSLTEAFTATALASGGPAWTTRSRAMHETHKLGPPLVVSTKKKN